MVRRDHRGLTAPEAAQVLDWLGVPPPTAATRHWLDTLLGAYVRRVPWESASRIVRRAAAATAAEAVAWPPQFWRAAMTQGHGGTCFESNAALAALLTAVGIDSTLTINDRPPIVACHTALVVQTENERLVVDAGFPLHATVPLPLTDETYQVTTAWGALSSRRLPDRPARIVIGQHPHPVPVAFELVDRAVPPAAYAAAVAADYGETGLFLNLVVIKKVVDGQVWRFTSGERPWTLERFTDGQRYTAPLPDSLPDVATALARHFAIDAATVAQALVIVGR